MQTGHINSLLNKDLITDQNVENEIKLFLLDLLWTNQIKSQQLYIN